MNFSIHIDRLTRMIFLFLLLKMNFRNSYQSSNKNDFSIFVVENEFCNSYRTCDKNGSSIFQFQAYHLGNFFNLKLVFFLAILVIFSISSLISRFSDVLSIFYRTAAMKFSKCFWHLSIFYGGFIFMHSHA